MGPAKPTLLVTTVVVTATVPTRPALRHRRGRNLVGSSAYIDAQRTHVLLAVFHVVMISVAAVLAVFRPGGRLRAARGAAGQP